MSKAQTKALVIGVGAERGLGAALAKRFAREGHHVIVAGRTLDKIETVAATIVAEGGRAEHFGVDATSEADVRAVFDRASPALETAVLIERTVRSRAWPAGVEVRVRIGIHSGRPTLTDTGYVGLAVHTVARICSAAHGGQILLSSAARNAVRQSPPAGVRFRSLGSHRFRGLREPQTIFQVEAADLQTRFPPLRTAAPQSQQGAG